MSTNIQTFSNNRIAATAQLGCVARAHGDEMRPSFFDFVRQHQPEHAQRRIVSGQRQAAVTGHKCEGQIFNSDKAVLLSQLCRQLMPEITALIGDTGLNLRPLPLGLAPTRAKLLTAPRAGLAAILAAIGGCQSAFRRSGPAGF